MDDVVEFLVWKIGNMFSIERWKWRRKLNKTSDIIQNGNFAPTGGNKVSKDGEELKRLMESGLVKKGF
jgi:hypothetical protein